MAARVFGRCAHNPVTPRHLTVDATVFARLVAA
jgi:hypothetical protein